MGAIGGHAAPILLGAIGGHAAPILDTQPGPRVGLFVTCLVDLFRPSVGFAAVTLLERAGCAVAVPKGQTCCGQPAYNSGDRKSAVAVARGVLSAFRDFDYVVAPSGSCAGQRHTEEDDVPRAAMDRRLPERRAAAEDLSRRTYELVSFLTDVRGVTSVDASFEGEVTYHDSCSALRELDVMEQPRRLLDSVAGLRRTELPNADVCCGFGGTFCVKYPEISTDMVRKKARAVASTGAGTLLSGDLGCLLNIAGRLEREGLSVSVRHVAEVLAGTCGNPAIGETKPSGSA